MTSSKVVVVVYVLEMLKVKEDRWFGGLEDDSPKVKWMRRVFSRVDYKQASVDNCYA